MNHINIAKLNEHHIGCKHGFLSIQHSIKHLANCIFRANCQICDLPIIPCIRYIQNVAALLNQLTEIILRQIMAIKATRNGEDGLM